MTLENVMDGFEKWQDASPNMRDNFRALCQVKSLSDPAAILSAWHFFYAGWKDGYESGMSDGYDTGYDEGYSNGQEAES